ncbi:uncharacterized protein TNCV_382551 [Trichonephila clavipes]|nr:uncharacterized protein TNCV_382551 [Trichonephila clavipes]
MDSTLTVTPHKSLNSCRGFVSESDLLCASEAEIFEGLSDQGVIQWYRYRTVACFVTGSSPVPLKTRRVGQRCTLNLSRAETSSRWCGVIVRRGGCQLRCRPRPWFKITWSVAKSPRVAEHCDVNIQSINQPQPNDFPSIPSASTSSYTTQANIFPSTSSIKPTTQFESRLLEPISSAAAAPNNSLNTSASFLSAKTRPLATSNKFLRFQLNFNHFLVPLPESVPTTFNSEHSNAPEIPQCVKRNSRKR